MEGIKDGSTVLLGGFELANILLLSTVVLLGQERKGRAFVQEHSSEAGESPAQDHGEKMPHGTAEQNP